MYPDRNQARIGIPLIAAAALAGSLALYQGSLQLPFFFDDTIHLSWLDWHSLPEVWTTAEGLGYYRPLTMSFWKVGFLLLGRNDPPLFHLLNLLLHAANATLTGCIAWRAWQGRGRLAFSFLATALFVTYPLSYQAVPSTSSLSKPLIAILMLSSALAYWEGRRRGSRVLGGLSLFLGALAPLAYETGVLAPVAILAVEVFARQRREVERWSRQPVLHILLVWGVILPAILYLEPESGASLSLPGLESLWRNTAYFLQGVMYPVAPLATPLARTFSLDVYPVVVVVSLVALGAVLAIYRRARQVDLALYALSWFAVGIGAQWLMLDFGYVIDSPRLFYLAAAGSALLIAGVPVLLWTNLRSHGWLKALVVAGVAGVLLFSVGYVRGKMDLAKTAAVPLKQAIAAARAEGDAARLVYVNVPGWIAPKEPTYAIGSEGLTFVPNYVDVEDWVYVNTGLEPRINTVMVDALKQDLDVYIGYAGEAVEQERLLRAMRRAGAVYVTSYAADGLAFVPAGAVEGAGDSSPRGAPLARFGDGIQLLAAEVETGSAGLRLSLWWSFERAPQGDVTVLAHVYDRDGKLVAQKDGYPLAGLYAPQAAQPGEVVRDVRTIAVEGEALRAPFSVAVGWYDRATGDRLPVVDSQGRPVAGGAFQVWPGQGP